MSLGSITGVSLGPGDPDLITIKGLNALRSADKIYYPGSQFSDGRQSSYSAEILKHYDLVDSKLEGFYLEMSLDREQANLIYDEVYQLVVKDIEDGLCVVIVSEGDVSTYSSIAYLTERFQEASIDIELIPGITSYNLGAALSKSSLGLQNDKVTILPRVQSVIELQEALQYSQTIVLMKIRSVMETVREVLTETQSSFVYGEYLGTDREFVTSDWADLDQRPIPYFSLIIVKR